MIHLVNGHVQAKANGRAFQNNSNQYYKYNIVKVAVRWSRGKPSFKEISTMGYA